MEPDKKPEVQSEHLNHLGVDDYTYNDPSGVNKGIQPGVVPKIKKSLYKINSEQDIKYSFEGLHKEDHDDDTIYVGDLPPNVEEPDIKNFFSQEGYMVQSVRTGNKKQLPPKFLQSAYVKLENPSGIRSAIEKLNHSYYRNAQLRVMTLQDKKRGQSDRDANIIVKNLPPETDNQILEETFKIFGDILTCKVKRDINGKPMGFGFIQYKQRSSAKTAVKYINQLKMMGCALKAEKHLSSESRKSKKDLINSTFTNLYIKNYPLTFTKEKIAEIFGAIGELTSVHFPLKEDETPSGVAFVNYLSHEDAVTAIEKLHGSIMFKEKDSDEPLYVQRAQSKTERGEELAIKYGGISRVDSSSKKKLYVMNLPPEIPEKEVAEIFGHFGKIMATKVGKDARSTEDRSYAWVLFSEESEAARALEQMDGGQVDCLRISVDYFRKKKESVPSLHSSGFTSTKQHSKERSAFDAKTQEEIRSELYHLVLSLAPSRKEKIRKAGFSNEDEFAAKITGIVIDLGEGEVKRSVGLGNVLSKYIDETLDEIIKQKESEA